jgi:hypothetical protein
MSNNAPRLTDCLAPALGLSWAASLRTGPRAAAAASQNSAVG